MEVLVSYQEENLVVSSCGLWEIWEVLEGTSNMTPLPKTKLFTFTEGVDDAWGRVIPPIPSGISPLKCGFVAFSKWDTTRYMYTLLYASLPLFSTGTYSSCWLLPIEKHGQQVETIRFLAYNKHKQLWLLRIFRFRLF